MAMLKGGFKSPNTWHSVRFLATKLFVGGLSFESNETALKNVFEKYGEIKEVRVICDHKSGKSEGYGFVRFACEDAAGAALNDLNGQLLDGYHIRVDYANSQ